MQGSRKATLCDRMGLLLCEVPSVELLVFEGERIHSIEESRMFILTLVKWSWLLNTEQGCGP